MNAKRMEEILTALRYAPSRSMLSYWHGKAGGYIEASDALVTEKMALWNLTMSAHECRSKELFELGTSPAFLLDQAA